MLIIILVLLWAQFNNIAWLNDKLFSVLASRVKNSGFVTNLWLTKFYGLNLYF